MEPILQNFIIFILFVDIFWESHNWWHQLLVHAPYNFYQYMYLLYVNRFFNLHHIPFFMCIVAPVTNSTDSGDPFSSTSNFCNNKANATVDSISANWPLTHFLCPPPKGRNAKSDILWWFCEFLDPLTHNWINLVN